MKPKQLIEGEIDMVNRLNRNTWLLLGILFMSGVRGFAQPVTNTATPKPDTGPELALDIKAPHYVTSIAFAPDSKTVASTGWDSAVTLWDTQSGAKQKTLGGMLGGPGAAVVFSPDGKLVACANSEMEIGAVVIWNAQSGEIQRTLPAPGRALTSIAFSPDGDLLATGSGRVVALADVPLNHRIVGEVRIWDVHTGELKLTITWDDNQVWSIAFSPDGKTIASGGKEEVRLWDVATGELKRRLNANMGDTTSLAFFAGGKMLAGAQQPEAIRIWDTETGELKRTFVGDVNYARMIAISPNEKLLASATPNQPIGIWDLQAGTLKWSLNGHSRAVLAVAFSPDGKLLASGGEDARLKLWRIKLRSTQNSP